MTNEEAIKTIKANYPSGGYEDLRKALDMAIEALQERKKGRWMLAEMGDTNLYKCSLCKRRIVTNSIENFPYCHCGAKMEVDE